MSRTDSFSRWTWRIAIAAALIYWTFAFLFWHFMGWLTPFIAPFLWLPVYALALTALAFAVLLPFRRWKHRGSASLLPLLFCIIVFVVTGFVDFTHVWLRTNFTLGRPAREEVVRLINAGELRPNVAHNASLIRLPWRYRELSLGGGEVMVEGDKVFFFTFRGILDNFAGFVYRPQDSPPQDGEFAGEFFIVEKMDDQWYYVSAR
jgi:hypothetical protein